ncbi:APO protein 3, mitochondrial-like [Chenopodium quinoa]|uniref:APO domain-containing protein n=1 Tax=Chenopodium quinoa TaxID=63459 RepID=A0A803N7E6_CHEQI|nr:APO protein 3, mitochondrial-like [Chenopodium quinoa]XP_021719325.1 APO protein 3, mitochondrial-like [Chenopodium quinoa]XP_021719328.1 APO protein 3, mitochondrial-like [Chenopodium quinoa]
MSLVKKIKLHQYIRCYLYCVSRHCHGGSGVDGEDVRVIPFGAEVDDPLYLDLPGPPRCKSERKPYVTPMKTLIKRAKEERELMRLNPCRVLEHPPDNGLLVPELVEVSRRVYWARESLLIGVSKLLSFIPVLRCRFCSEIHIGHVGHEIRTCTGPGSGFRRAMHDWKKGRLTDVIYFPKCVHLNDRVGKPRVIHNERFDVHRISAILELCIQAGVNLEQYPVRRRTKPVYCIEGRIVDFDPEMGESNANHDKGHSNDNLKIDSGFMTEVEDIKGDSIKDLIHPLVQLNPEKGGSLKELSIGTMASWFEMISGARKIMEKYSVWTCGYCPEVQVGPKGHKLRMCKASRHQSRDGLHAWQEATIDDLVGPNYVWHVRDPSGPPLCNNLKRYYGKAPAVVELCVQAGAPVPEQYRSMLRLDVVPPDIDEVDLVV